MRRYTRGYGCLSKNTKTKRKSGEQISCSELPKLVASLFAVDAILLEA